MARYIELEGSEWMYHSDPHDEMRLALVLEEGTATDIKSRASEYEISVDRRLPSGVLLVTARASRAREFVDISAIRSVSTADGMTAQA
mgnify:CR=1 FL=1